MSEKRSTQNVAYHEAGHAVAHLVMNVPMRRASIIPKENTLGFVSVQKSPRWLTHLFEFGNPWENNRATRYILAAIICYMAGKIAEKKFTGRNNNLGSKSDMEMTYRLAETICFDNDEIRALLKWLSLHTEKLISKHWESVDVLAKKLLDEKSLSAKEIRKTLINVYPNVVPEQPINTKDKEEIITMVLQKLVFGQRKIIENELSTLPPGAERNTWKEAVRIYDEGRYKICDEKK